MPGETADFNVSVGLAKSVENASYSGVTKAQITFAPEFRLPFAEGSVLTATPNVKSLPTKTKHNYSRLWSGSVTWIQIQ